MKVVGKAGKEVLVTLTNLEYAAIIGCSVYDNKVKEVFHENETPELEIQETIQNVLLVSSVPAELNNIKKRITEALGVVEKAISAAKKVTMLKNGVEKESISKL